MPGGPVARADGSHPAVLLPVTWQAVQPRVSTDDISMNSGGYKLIHVIYRTDIEGFAKSD